MACRGVVCRVVVEEWSNEVMAEKLEATQEQEGKRRSTQLGVGSGKRAGREGRRSTVAALLLERGAGAAAAVAVV